MLKTYESIGRLSCPGKNASWSHVLLPTRHHLTTCTKANDYGKNDYPELGKTQVQGDWVPWVKTELLEVYGELFFWKGRGFKLILNLGVEEHMCLLRIGRGKPFDYKWLLMVVFFSKGESKSCTSSRWSSKHHQGPQQLGGSAPRSWSSGAIYRPFGRGTTRCKILRGTKTITMVIHHLLSEMIFQQGQSFPSNQIWKFHPSYPWTLGHL